MGHAVSQQSGSSIAGQPSLHASTPAAPLHASPRMRDGCSRSRHRRVQAICTRTASQRAGQRSSRPPPLPLHAPLLDKPNCEYWIRLGSFINQLLHSTTHLHASGLGRQRAVHHARPVLRLALDELQSMDRVVAKSAACSWSQGHPPWRPYTPRLFTRLIHLKLPSPSHTALTRKLDGVDALAGARQHAVSQKPAVPPTYKHTPPLRTCLMA